MGAVGLGDLTGELAALGGALLWAIASSIYAQLGKQVSPLLLNLTKGVIAITLLCLTILVRQDLQPDTTPQAIAFLAVSGAIGIGLGDTAFFESLNCLGARRGLLLESLAPPMAALIALITLRELLGLNAWIGILLTVVGVAWVVIERTPKNLAVNFRPGRGILFGLLAALGQASGAVLSRAALSETNISPLWSSLIRLIGGGLVLMIWIGFTQHRSKIGQIWRSPRLLGIIATTSFLGTYLGIWLQQTALKFTAAGIAQALNSTSPLFIIPIAIWMGDRVSPRAVLGVVVSLSGIWLLFFSRIG